MCGLAEAGDPGEVQAESADQPLQEVHRQRLQPVAQIASIEHMLEAAEVGLSAEVVEQVPSAYPGASQMCAR